MTETVQTTTPKRFNFSWRAVTSLSLVLSSLLMSVSGVFLFLAPSTRIARETHWRMWGLSKSEWIDIHLVFCALFLVVAIVHLGFNWRPLVGYLRQRVAHRFRLRYEWLIALAVTALFWAGARTGMPPFSVLLEWRAKFHGGHCCEQEPCERGTVHTAPGFGQKTLAQYCTEQGVNLDEALQRLRAAGIRARAHQTLRQIADENGYSRPSEIVRLLQTR